MWMHATSNPLLEVRVSEWFVGEISKDKQDFWYPHPMEFNYDNPIVGV